MAISPSLGTYFSPNKVVVGYSAAARLGLEAKELGSRAALIVASAGRAAAGWTTDLADALVRQDIEVTVFEGVETGAPARVVDECAAVARACGADLIVGLGGGSTLDTAKGVALVVGSGGGILDLADGRAAPGRRVRLILLPTTWSGSEVSAGFAVLDEGTGSKVIVDGVSTLPDVALVDPTYALSLPPGVTAETGMDALVHAIEPYLSPDATPLSDALALQAISLVCGSLPDVHRSRGSGEAGLNMSYASVLAGVAFSSAGLGPVHDLAFVVEERHGLSHARACAVLLPLVLARRPAGDPRRYKEIARAMGREVGGVSDGSAVQTVLDEVNSLLRELGVETEPTRCGFDADELLRRN